MGTALEKDGRAPSLITEKRHSGAVETAGMTLD